MGSRSRRRLSSESSLASVSSSSAHSLLSSYDSQSEFSDSEFQGGEGGGRGERKPKSRSLFNDVKVILSKHDRKLLKVEDDLNLMVRWLNEKFGFILKQGSTSSVSVSIASGLGDDDHGIDVVDALVPGGEVNPEDVFYEETILEKNQVRIDESSIAPQAPPTPEVGRLSRAPLNQDGAILGTSTGQNEVAYVGAANYNIDRGASSPSVSIIATARPTTTTPAIPPQQRRKHYNSSQPRRPKDPSGSQLPSQCDLCGKFLKDPNSLRQHKQIHLDIRKFNCPEPDCGKSFRRKFHLQTHSLIHKGLKKHQCGYCGRLFLLQKDLISHERIHTGDRPFKCKDCPKSFILKSHLVMHVRTHTGEKPYECEVCSKCFSQSNSLRLHKMKVHKNPNSQQQPKSKKKSSPKPKGGRKGKTSSVPIPNSDLHLGASSTPIPGKLPLYRNQGTILTSFPGVVNPSTPVVTFIQQQQPLLNPIEILEPLNVNAMNIDRFLLTQSSTNNGVNIFQSGGQGTSEAFISSEILDIP